MRQMIKPLCFTALLHSLCLPPLYALTQDEQARLEKLREFQIDALLELEIYDPSAGLAARKEQKLRETPAALFVISQEDIRRGGFTSIPEALRMVPGLQVGKIDGNKWAISARGFNARFAGKLLVMIDGRTVYSLLRSEVYWDVQDTLLEDVERIEVIRGPGAALWGENAVNGVINIITKATADTQGALLSAHAGSGEENAIVGARYGGKLGNQGHYRVYGKYYDHGYMKNAAGADQDSRWRNHRAGFRTDWQAAEYDHFTVQGDVYDGWTNQENRSVTNGVSVERINLNGYNLLSRWHRELQRGDLSLQAYYDWNERKEADFQDSRGTFDLDFQHRTRFSPRYEFIWGLGYRFTFDDIQGSPTLFYDPDQRQDQLFSVFFNSDYALIPNQLRLIAGSKVSHNDYSGVEIQPNLRLLWTPNQRHQLWTALSRAVRAPSRTDADFNLLVPMGQGLKLNLIGDDDFKAEEVTAFELGYRFSPSPNFLLDATAFINHYDQLGPNSQNVGFVPPDRVVQKITNGFAGYGYGAELAAHWQMQENWRLIATYSYITLDLQPMSGVTTSSIGGEESAPPNQASIRSLWDINDAWQWDMGLYYVDNVPISTVGNYLRLDTRLSWRGIQGVELAVGARNLLDAQHPEFNADVGEVGGQTPRTVYMQVQYEFN